MLRLRIFVLIMGDFVLLSLLYFLAAGFYVMSGMYPDFEMLVTEENLPGQIITVVLMLMVGIYFTGLYENIRVYSRRVLFEDLVMVFGVSFLMQSLMSYARSSLVMSRWIMMGGSIIAILGLVLWRWLYSVLLVKVVGRQKILFLGDDPLARQMAEEILKRPERGYEVVGCIAASPEGEFPGAPWVSIGDDLGRRIAELKPDRITVTGKVDAGGTLGRELLRCSMQGLTVETSGDLFESIFHRVALSTVTPQQLVFSESFRPHAWVILLQEIYGRIFALVGLVLFSPAMLLTALAVKLDTPGPVILKQVRLGIRGVPFNLLKFRSMHVDADLKFGTIRAKENDPRITRVGKWIRLTRLDETPQFWNVLRGEMSLVGPRPEMPELEQKLLADIPLYPQRHRVKPGITGWAQINHEPEDTIGQTVRKLEFDLYYIKRLSPAFDLMIMFHTAKAVILRLGAR
jgi:exopolysaccharide biosynthesis polyprenyl glycosylphosphotransferase